MEAAMSRHAIGDRPMTSSERQRRYLAKLAANAAEASRQAPRGDGSLSVKLDHLRLYPDRVAPWLRQRLGYQATHALRDALSRALKAAPAEPAEPEE
jgi:hypothetical protein